MLPTLMPTVMRAALLGGLFAAATPAVAVADGWADCNGPDKNGKGCTTSGRDSASIGAGLAIVAAVAFGLGRRRDRR